MIASKVAREAEDVIVFLVESGLADDQNIPYLRDLATGQEITFTNAHLLTLLLKDKLYEDAYTELLQERSYCARLLDGALLQLSYEFENERLLRHRLAYLPSPYLRQYSEDREIYEDDPVYAEVISKRILPVPVRFDADFRDDVEVETEHPASHVSLGQFTNCRVAATSPVSPRQFVEFILRSFYYLGFNVRSSKFPSALGSFPVSIHQSEMTMVHIAIPIVKTRG